MRLIITQDIQGNRLKEFIYIQLLANKKRSFLNKANVSFVLTPSQRSDRTG